jgi:hypothetical protein
MPTAAHLELRSELKADRERCQSLFAGLLKLHEREKPSGAAYVRALMQVNQYSN